MKIDDFFFEFLQALITIPRNPSQCPIKKIGFSTALSRRPCSLSSARVSSSSVGSNFGPLFAKRDFVVRAESSSEGEVAESSEESVEVGSEAVAEAEEESKPPRKLRVKLGDVMGVICSMPFRLS